MNLRVLLIEDDATIRRYLKATLSSQGYDLTEAQTGRDGLALAASSVPDLILLDLGLPDIDGMEIIKQVREWSSLPIIIISARGQERDKIAGLDAGADDYLTKPFGTGELLARIRSAQRRVAHAQGDITNPVITIGDLKIDLDRRQVFREEVEIRLTPIEYKFFSVLIKYMGKVVTHSLLLREVWGPSFTGQNHYLRIFILQLRRKLEKDPTRPRYIITEPGVGYRMKDE